MPNIRIPYETIVAVPFWVIGAVTAVAVVTALTALGHLVGSCYHEPRNNPGSILGFVQSIFIIALAGALISGSAAGCAVFGALAAVWLFYSLTLVGAIR